MTEVERLLQRQAAWQKSRAALTWPEKIRMAEQVRDSVKQWRIHPTPVRAHPRNAVADAVTAHEAACGPVAVDERAEQAEADRADRLPRL